MECLEEKKKVKLKFKKMTTHTESTYYLKTSTKLNYVFTKKIAQKVMKMRKKPKKKHDCSIL